MSSHGDPPPALLLSQARKAAGISQTQLAIRGGTSQAAISRIERGTEEPTVARLRELLLVCGFDLDLGLKPRPLPADPEEILHHRAVPMARRGDRIAAANQMAGEFAVAGEEMWRAELARLVEAQSQ